MLRTVRDYVRWYRKAHPRCSVELRFLNSMSVVEGIGWLDYVRFCVRRYESRRDENKLVLYLDGEHV